MNWLPCLFVWCGSLLSSFAVDPAPFAWRNPVLTSAGIADVTHGAYGFVAVGETEGRGDALFSPDGIDWSNVSTEATNTLTAIVFAKGLYVAVGGGGRISTSSDGRQWVSRPSGTASDLRGITFTGTEFVAVGGRYLTLYGQATVARSEDGLTWTSQDIPETRNPWSSIAFGNGKYIAVRGGSDNSIYVSSNAVDWVFTQVPHYDTTTVTFGSGGFVLGGIFGLAFSSDAVTWTLASYLGDLYLKAVRYANGKYVAVGGSGSGNSGKILTSTNGTNWSTTVVIPDAGALLGIAANSERFVAVGNNGTILASEDGTTWMNRNRNSLPTIYRLIHANGLFTGMGSPRLAPRSSDGKTWSFEQITNNSDYYVHDLAYIPGLYVAVGGGDQGVIYISSDGTNWALQSTVCCAFSGVTYGPAGFVAVGADYLGGSAAIATSVDGLVWTNRSPSLTNEGSYYRYLNAVTYGNSLYVAVGWAGSIVSSSAGVTWTKRTTATASYSLNDVIFTNGQFIAVGSQGTALTSANGFSWTPISMGIPDTLNAIAYANGTFVAVGAGGVMMISTNGSAWTRAQSGTTVSFHAICYGNGTFVVAGERGAILQSRDFLHPLIEMRPASTGFQVMIAPSEFGRQYRLEASAVPTFSLPSTLRTYSNIHTNIVFSEPTTNGARFYRVVSP